MMRSGCGVILGLRQAGFVSRLRRYLSAERVVGSMHSVQTMYSKMFDFLRGSFRSGGSLISLASASESEAKTMFEDLALYVSPTCFFCVRVRRHLSARGVAIELRDVRRDPRYRDELIREGGMSQVPCLRIEEPDGSAQWLYESRDIIAYIEGRLQQS